MHILVIPSWYKSPDSPFMGSFFEEQARALMKAGNCVSIFYPNFYPLAYFFHKKIGYETGWDDHGLKTYIYRVQSIFPRSRRINNYYLLRKSNKEFKSYIKKNGTPDLIHAHSVYDAGMIGLFLSRKYHIPMVITEHLTHFTGTLKGDVFKLNLASDIFKNAQASIAVSNHFKKDLERELGLPDNLFRVVYNMVGEIFYKTFIPKKYKAGEEFIFFTNSFLNKRKNHPLIFDALKILVDKKIPVKLIVGGAGEMEALLKEYIQSHLLEKHVTFLGGLTRLEVKQQIDACHAFLLASTFESFGVVLIESLASGRPVISTNSGGPAEILNENNGYLVNSFEPKAYASAMEQMILHYTDFNQENIRLECQKYFSEDSIINQLTTIYKEVLKNYK